MNESTTLHTNPTATGPVGGRLATLWIRWLLAGALAYGIAGPAGVFLGNHDQLLSVFLSFGGGTLLFCAFQTRLLGNLVSARAWILQGAIAVSIMGAWMLAVGTADTHLGLYGATFLGPGLCVLQWRLLRRTGLPRPGWWILATFAGWVLGGFLMGAEYMNERPWHPGGWIVFGSCYGGMLGLAITGLLRAAGKRRETEPRS